MGLSAINGTPGERDVLIVTDPQRDFCPGGALAVPQGDANAGAAEASNMALRVRARREKREIILIVRSTIDASSKLVSKLRRMFAARSAKTRLMPMPAIAFV